VKVYSENKGGGKTRNRVQFLCTRCENWEGNEIGRLKCLIYFAKLCLHVSYSKACITFIWWPYVRKNM
jgi:hypothetical protein